MSEKVGLYGEPWTVYEGDANGRKYFIQGADATSEFGRIIAGMDFRGDDYLPRTDVWCRMRRAAQCVNACAGIDDPAAELATLRARVADLEAEREECRENCLGAPLDDVRTWVGKERLDAANARIAELEAELGHQHALVASMQDEDSMAIARAEAAEERVAELETMAQPHRSYDDIEMDKIAAHLARLDGEGE